jgi:Protein of unknown function (DUF1499)
MLYCGRSLSCLIILVTVIGRYVNGWSLKSDVSSASSPLAMTHSRRDIFRSVAITAAGSVLVSSSSPFPADATVPACPKGSKNCIRTAWIAPAGTSTKDISKTVGTIFESYPQSGQADVDLGGWTNVEGKLLAGDTSAKYEYSSGVGKFAKFFNGGKPFIDDVLIEINDTNVDIRSSSRVGDSDFDVNKLRLQYLGQKVKDLGWTVLVPDLKY